MSCPASTFLACSQPSHVQGKAVLLHACLKADHGWSQLNRQNEMRILPMEICCWDDVLAAADFVCIFGLLTTNGHGQWDDMKKQNSSV